MIKWSRNHRQLRLVIINSSPTPLSWKNARRLGRRQTFIASRSWYFFVMCSSSVHLVMNAIFAAIFFHRVHFVYDIVSSCHAYFAYFRNLCYFWKILLRNKRVERQCITFGTEQNFSQLSCILACIHSVDLNLSFSLPNWIVFIGKHCSARINFMNNIKRFIIVFEKVFHKFTQISYNFISESRALKHTRTHTNTNK